MTEVTQCKCTYMNRTADGNFTVLHSVHCEHYPHKSTADWYENTQTKEAKVQQIVDELNLQIASLEHEVKAKQEKIADLIMQTDYTALHIAYSNLQKQVEQCKAVINESKELAVFYSKISNGKSYMRQGYLVKNLVRDAYTDGGDKAKHYLNLLKSIGL